MEEGVRRLLRERTEADCLKYAEEWRVSEGHTQPGHPEIYRVYAAFRNYSDGRARFPKQERRSTDPSRFYSQDSGSALTLSTAKAGRFLHAAPSAPWDTYLQAFIPSELGDYLQ